MKRVFLSLALIATTVGVVSLGATKAFFTDKETASGSFVAGAIDLLVGSNSFYNGIQNLQTSWEKKDLTLEKFFDFDDLKPGDYGSDTVTLYVDNNDSYICADVTLTSNNENGCNTPEGLVDNTCGNPGEGKGELADKVNFIWWADDGDGVLEDDEVVISGPQKIGAMPLNMPYPITLADSVKNVWNAGLAGGPALGATDYKIAKAWCFGDMVANPLTQDGSGSLISPATDNNGDGNIGTPADSGIICNGAFLGNETQTDSLTADISFRTVQARHNESFMCETPTLTCNPEQTYATRVVDYSQGKNKNGTNIVADRTNPNAVLGAPQSSGSAYDSSIIAGSFFSLGFNPDVNATSGGWIIVEFGDGYIVDGPGNDLRAWEVTGGEDYPMEKVKIEVSQDGDNWYEVAASLDRDAEADLADSGLSWAKYVKLTDVSDRSEFEATADGYDLDAFSALNCAVLP